MVAPGGADAMDRDAAAGNVGFSAGGADLNTWLAVVPEDVTCQFKNILKLLKIYNLYL